MCQLSKYIHILQTKSVSLMFQYLSIILKGSRFHDVLTTRLRLGMNGKEQE